MNHGKFVITLDFELMWGVRDKKTIDQYGENIKAVHTVVPRLLDLFSKHDIHATFSAIGFMFFESKEELLSNLPDRVPAYENQKLSPFHTYLEKVGANYMEDPYHFAPLLIKKIREYPGMEIGTHTFSHYYCLEKGQSIEDFESDIKNAKKVAEKYGLEVSSLVFPRNQFIDEYLDVCRELGITCYRGNEHSWLYEARNEVDESSFRRALRLMDAYVNISGHNCYTDEYLQSKTPMDIPSSRFLRPFSRKLKVLDGLRLRRIKTGMSHAAKKNLTYHLWWHPHNFGADQEENFRFLEKILAHFKFLESKYGFQSYSMSELARKISNEG